MQFNYTPNNLVMPRGYRSAAGQDPQLNFIQQGYYKLGDWQTLANSWSQALTNNPFVWPQDANQNPLDGYSYKGLELYKYAPASSLSGEVTVSGRVWVRAPGPGLVFVYLKPQGYTQPPAPQLASTMLHPNTTAYDSIRLLNTPHVLDVAPVYMNNGNVVLTFNNIKLTQGDCIDLVHIFFWASPGTIAYQQMEVGYLHFTSALQVNYLGRDPYRRYNRNPPIPAS